MGLMQYKVSMIVSLTAGFWGREDNGLFHKGAFRALRLRYLYFQNLRPDLEEKEASLLHSWIQMDASIRAGLKVHW